MKTVHLQRTGLLLSVLLLSACAAPNVHKPLYYWGSYQPQVYNHFKNDSADPQQEIEALEKTVQQARASGDTLPPGFHAHLGMLYAQAGKGDQVRQQFESEKTQFPESATFMDFLLRKFKK